MDASTYFSVADARAYLYDRGVASLTIDATADLVTAGREWLSDCEWEDVDADDFARMAPIVVMRGVHRFYEGGAAAFVAGSTDIIPAR